MTAMAIGSEPALMLGPAVLVAVSIGVTEPASPLVTYAVFPLGVIAMAVGSDPVTRAGCFV
jgi:hypothetical protein